MLNVVSFSSVVKNVSGPKLGAIKEKKTHKKHNEQRRRNDTYIGRK